MRAENAEYPCVCCGYVVHAEAPNSHRICHVCFWEDDATQLRWPTSTGGANKASLVEAQANYSGFGASEYRFVSKVRNVRHDDFRPAGFRCIDLRVDDFEPNGVQCDDWPRDSTRLYWWRQDFWRKA
ncbi:CPCC family cysteine-rich protein [Saccharomonospora iraqiensis]|uniref:CPCC family cysteine-rich protein n=1 Tax=Saccharomonospora iraqiensis TaxID=52698 RepID=UPI00047DB317|nr:CPCC family cysteine-rich protein [Saccharomonospora iraqiensis]